MRYVDAMTAKAVHELLATYRNELAGEIIATPAPTDSDRREKQLRAKRERLLKLYEANLRTWPYTFREINAVDVEIERLSTSATAPAATLPAVLEWLSAMEEHWRDGSTEEKRGLLLAVGAEITVNTARKSPLWIELRAEQPPGVIKVHLKGCPHPKHGTIPPGLSKILNSS